MKKKIIISIIVLFVLVVLGVGGYFLFSMFQAPVEFEDTDAKFETTLKEVPNDGSNPNDHTIEDNVAFALYKITITNEFKTITNGDAVAVGVEQSVYNERVVKNGKAMNTMITNGMIKNAKQRYFMKDKVLLRGATEVTGRDSAIWATTEPECVTYATIKKRYGWFPTEATGYIICSDTYLNKDQMTMVDNGDNTYTISFDLDPDEEKAPFWYRREVATNGNSTMKPQFFSVHFEMKIDSNWTILQNTIDESYKVKSFGVEAVTNTHCVEDFYYENVEFDKDAYDFFESFGYLTAMEDSNDDEVKTDPLSIIVESLQNKDGSDTLLDLNLHVGSNSLSGNVALNISDLQNVKVVAKLDDLYVEYSDKIYLSLGGLKAQASTDEISGLIGSITDLLPKSDSSNSSLDVNKILDELGKCKVEEKDSKVYIDGALHIANIEIPLHFIISHENDSYKLISASTSISLMGEKIDVEISSSTKKPEVLNKNGFMNLTNLDFILNDVVEIIKNKKVDIDLTLEYQGINIHAFGQVDFNEGLKASLNLELEYQNDTIELELSYIEDTIYVDLYNLHLKIEKDDLMKIVSKFTDTSIELDTSSLDINKILEVVLNLDYDKLLKEVIIEKDHFSITTDLEDVVEKLKEIKLDLKNTDYGMSGFVSLLGFDANIKVGNLGYRIKDIDDSKYQNLGYLDEYLDYALAIYDSKELELTVSMTYEGIDISLDAIIDFNDGLKIDVTSTLTYDTKTINLAITYIDDILYVDASGIKISLKKEVLMGVLDNLIKSNSFDLATLFNIDFNTLIESLNISSEEIDLVLNLSSLVSFLNEVSIKLKLEDVLTGTISIKDLGNASITLDKSNKVITKPEGEFSSFDNIMDLVNKILDELSNKKLELTASVSYDKLDANIYGILDYLDELKVSLDATINYDGLEINANINYLKTYKEYQDVLLINLGNNHILLELSKLDLGLDEISLDSILGIVFSIDFAKLLKSIELNDKVLNLSLDLSDFNILDLALVDVHIDYSDGIKVSSSELFNLDLSLQKTLNTVLIEDYEYVSITEFVSNVLELVKWIKNESFTIALDGSVDIKNIKLDILGNVDFILDNDKYIIRGNMKLTVFGSENQVSFVFKDNMFYLSYGNIHIGLDTKDLSKFIEDAISNLGLDLDLSFELSKINPLIDSLVVMSNGVSVDLSSLVDFISLINVTFNKNDNGFDLAISSNEINLDASISKCSLYDVVIPDNYINNEDLLKLCSHIGKILNLIKETSFNAHFDLSIYEDNALKFDIEGYLDLIINKEEDKEFSLDDLVMKVNLMITEYTGNTIKVVHRLSVTWIDDYIYVEYGNNESNQSSKISIYAKKSSILSIVEAITRVLGMELDFLAEYKDSSLDYVDFTQLTDLFKKNSSISLNIESLIQSLAITDNGLVVELNLHSIFDFIPEDKIARVDVLVTENSISASVTNLYTDYVSLAENKKIEISEVTILSKEVSIVAPTNLSNYYDISDIDKLIVGALTTASNKDYEIQGNATLSVIGLINVDVPIYAKVRVLEDGSPLIYVHLDLNDIPSLASIAGLKKKDTYIYYKDGYVYIHRRDNNGTTYDLKVTYQEFFNDLLYYLLDFGMGMPDSIMSKINSSKTDENYVIDAGQVIKNYSYTTNKFTIKLSMEALTGNSDLGDMALSLNLGNVGVSYNEDMSVNSALAFKSITDFSMNLVSVIDLTANSIKLVNFKNENGYEWFTTIDMSDVDNFIDSYDYGTDMIFENGKYKGKREHTVTFILDNGSDPVIYKGQAGMEILFPTLTVKEEDSKYYVFDGWYLDKYKTEEFRDTQISENSIKLYAKWKEVNYHTLTIHSILGDSVDSLYNGESLDRFYHKKNEVIDNKTYIFMGYSLTLDGDVLDIQFMPDNDLELYAIYKEVSFKVYLDGTYYMDLNSDTNLALTKNYALVADDYYLEFNKEDITYNTLVGVYSVYADIVADNGIFYLVSLDSLTDVYQITLDVKEAFNNKGYVSILLPSNINLDYQLLPNGTYNHYGINYWYNGELDFHSQNILSLEHVDQTLHAYYSTIDYLSFGLDSSNGSQMVSVTNFSYNQDDLITVILPKYVFINGEYKVVESIASFADGDEIYSVFSGKTNIKAIYFNEGFKVLGANAFKNSTKLTTIYFSNTVTSVASDAFYMNFSSTFEKCREVCVNIRFYLASNSILSTSGWLACKWNTSKKYYGEKTTLLGSIDLRNAFNTYSLDIKEIVSSLF